MQQQPQPNQLQANHQSNRICSGSGKEECESPLDVVDSRSQLDLLKLNGSADKLTKKVKRSTGIAVFKGSKSKEDTENAVQAVGEVSLGTDEGSQEAIDLESTGDIRGKYTMLFGKG